MHETLWFSAEQNLLILAIRMRDPNVVPWASSKEIQWLLRIIRSEELHFSELTTEKTLKHYGFEKIGTL